VIGYHPLRESLYFLVVRSGFGQLSGIDVYGIGCNDNPRNLCIVWRSGLCEGCREEQRDTAAAPAEIILFMFDILW
jgi:hypothetical protein